MSESALQRATRRSSVAKTSASPRAVPPHSRLGDDQLVELAKTQDPHAFEVLMRRYNRRLFRIARSVLRHDAAAEDAVQEAYIRAFTHLNRYKPAGRFDAWLTRIAFNEALMNRRKLRNEVSLEDVDERVLQGADQDDGETGAEHVDTASARRLLEQAVDALPEHFRTVFMLRAVEQLSINDTAACLGLSAATIKTRMHRANLRLRADLTRRLRRQSVSIFEFDGARCDRIVFAVHAHLRTQHMERVS